MKIHTVYPNSTCISLSTHPGALPSPAYPYFPNHKSVELYPVELFRGYWAETSSKTFGDGQPYVLAGHDTGMMIPHLSPVMDNLMIGLTLLCSSCTWPFATIRRKVEGKGIVGFRPVIAPYIYCDEHAEDEPTSDAVQAKKAPNLKIGQRKKSSLIKGKPKLEKAAKFGKSFVSGMGLIYIPVKKTVALEMSPLELLAGWAMFVGQKGLDAAAGKLTGYMSVPKGKFKRLDSDAARRRGLQAVSRKRMRGKVARKARRQALKELGGGLAEKAVVDGLKGVGGMAFGREYKAPFGIYSYDFAEGKGTVLWHEYEGTAKFETGVGIFDEGLKGMMNKAVKDSFNPSVGEMLRNNPNFAGAS